MFLETPVSPIETISVNGGPVKVPKGGLVFDKGAYHMKLISQMGDLLQVEIVAGGLGDNFEQVDGPTIVCTMKRDSMKLFQETTLEGSVTTSQIDGMLKDISEAKYMEHSFRGALERIAMTLGMPGSPDLAVDVPREVERRFDLMRQADELLQNLLHRKEKR